jgi:hypothetical protein
MLIDFIDPIQKLKEISTLSDFEINKWLWMNNKLLGGTMPIYLFGTDRESKVIALFKKYSESKNRSQQ